MLWIALYYLTTVFNVFSLGPVSDFIGSATGKFIEFIPG